MLSAKLLENLQSLAIAFVKKWGGKIILSNGYGNYTPSGPSTYIIIPRLLILASSLFDVIKNISDVFDAVCTKQETKFSEKKVKQHD